MAQFEYIDLESLVKDNVRPSDTVQALTLIAAITRLKAGKSSIRRTRTRAIEGYTKARNKIIEFLDGQGYYTFKAGSEWVGLKDNNNTFVESMVLFSITDATIDARAYGNNQEVDKIIEYIDEAFSTLGTLVQTAYDLTDRGDIVFSQKYMPNEGAMIAKQSFYPWLDVPLEEYFKAYMESGESILVLFGPPGVGKSTFLRSLIVSGNYDTYLAYSKKVVESPNLISRFYRSSIARILAYEDIDNYLKSREDGNLLMAPILNASEGVVKHEGKKIVFSTNLPSIDRIDPALLRQGRCFDILPFRNLTRDEAATAAHDAGVEQKDWNAKDSWPLAEVLSKVVAEQQTVNRYGKKAGFY
ncbi:hypothetical protein [Burkholderia phage FLC9]|nr:hypothetical protein [Burkholderia phage FLC9]